MDNTRLFLIEIVGGPGAEALCKSTSSTLLGQAILPRTILSWVNETPKYEGDIPGIPNTYLEFSPTGDLFNGSISINDQIYSFEKASPLHLASAIAVALGIDGASLKNIADRNLQKLGKSIDLLVKAQKQQPKTGAKATPTQPIDLQGPTQPSVKQKEKGPTVSVKPPPVPGPEALPPSTPMTEQAKKVAQNSTKGPKAPKTKKTKMTIKVTKSQATAECPVCRLPQFRAGDLYGCKCWRSLVKNISASPTPEGYLLEVPLEIDREELVTLLESMGIT